MKNLISYVGKTIIQTQELLLVQNIVKTSVILAIAAPGLTINRKQRRFRYSTGHIIESLPSVMSFLEKNHLFLALMNLSI